MVKKHFLLILSLFSIGVLTSSTNLVKASNQAPQKRVLVVDDNRLLRETTVPRMIESASRILGISVQVDTAEDAQAAISKAGSQNYDLIVSDGEMGGGNKDANTLVRELRGAGNTVPIIIFSSTLSDWQNHSDIRGKPAITFFNKNDNAGFKREVSRLLQ